jgi:uridine kinase
LRRSFIGSLLFPEIFDTIHGMEHPKLIVIAGGTASGKTTIADAVAKRLAPRCGLITLDSYYRDQNSIEMSQRILVNYDHPDSIEFDLLLKHLTALKSGADVAVPVYDFAQHTRDLGRTESVMPAPYIVLEGILALYDARVRAAASLTVFVDAPADERFRRRLERDVRERGRTPDGVRAQWEKTVEPMYQELCAPTVEFANLVLDGTAPIEGSVELVIQRAQK